MLAIGVASLGLGLLNVMLALVVLAVPPMLTNAYVAVDGVDRDIVDAARGMGMTRLGDPAARRAAPGGAAALRGDPHRGAVYVVATDHARRADRYSGGLGDIIDNQASYQLSGVLGAAICVAVLALVVEALFAGLQRLRRRAGCALARRRRPSRRQALARSRQADPDAGMTGSSNDRTTVTTAPGSGPASP